MFDLFDKKIIYYFIYIFLHNIHFYLDVYLKENLEFLCVCVDFDSFELNFSKL